jgi:plasmid stabilization system protein ParE
MAYEVVRSAACDADLEIIFDFLARSYEEIGETADEASERAAARLRDIEADLQRLGAAPHQGTLWPEVRGGLRWVTKRRAILYFVVDEAAARVSVLAVFYGGQDHRSAVLARILGPA